MNSVIPIGPESMNISHSETAGSANICSSIFFSSANVHPELPARESRDAPGFCWPNLLVIVWGFNIGLG